MDIIRKARTLETNIARRLGAAARSLVKTGPREPLEVTHAIVDAVERHIQLGGRGRRVFPFNAVTVSVLAATDEARTQFDAVLIEEPGLRSRIVERLQRAGCDPEPLIVNVEYASWPGRQWTDPEFGLKLSKQEIEAPPPVLANPVPLALAIEVVRGTVITTLAAFAQRRINFGRSAEVRDQRRRLVRTNDVAFLEGGDEANATVSRQHAHVEYETSSRSHRIHDDGSAQGTGLVRDGRTIAVPRGGSGVRLRSGDEIVLGEARVRISIADS